MKTHRQTTMIITMTIMTTVSAMTKLTHGAIAAIGTMTLKIAMVPGTHTVSSPKTAKDALIMYVTPPLTHSAMTVTGMIVTLPKTVAACGTHTVSSPLTATDAMYTLTHLKAILNWSISWRRRKTTLRKRRATLAKEKAREKAKERVREKAANYVIPTSIHTVLAATGMLTTLTGDATACGTQAASPPWTAKVARFPTSTTWTMVLTSTTCMNQPCTDPPWMSSALTRPAMAATGCIMLTAQNVTVRGTQTASLPVTAKDAGYILTHLQATLWRQMVTLMRERATLARERATLAREMATMARERATLARERATLARERATLANERSTLMKERAGEGCTGCGGSDDGPEGGSADLE